MNPMVSVRVEGEREEEDPAVSAILSLVLSAVGRKK